MARKRRWRKDWWPVFLIWGKASLWFEERPWVRKLALSRARFVSSRCSQNVLDNSFLSAPCDFALDYWGNWVQIWKAFYWRKELSLCYRMKWREWIQCWLHFWGSFHLRVCNLCTHAMRSTCLLFRTLLHRLQLIMALSLSFGLNQSRTWNRSNQNKK